MPGMAWRDGGDLVAEPPTTGATRFWQVDQPPAWLSRCKRQLQWARHSRFLSNPGKHPIFSLLSGCPVTPRCAQPPWSSLARPVAHSLQALRWQDLLTLQVSFDP